MRLHIITKANGVANRQRTNKQMQLRIRKEKQMEMCYNGALVMPSNYAIVNDNEMEYVEGVELLL